MGIRALCIKSVDYDCANCPFFAFDLDYSPYSYGSIFVDCFIHRDHNFQFWFDNLGDEADIF